MRETQEWVERDLVTWAPLQINLEVNYKHYRKLVLTQGSILLKRETPMGHTLPYVKNSNWKWINALTLVLTLCHFGRRWLQS